MDVKEQEIVVLRIGNGEKVGGAKMLARDGFRVFWRSVPVVTVLLFTAVLASAEKRLGSEVELTFDGNRVRFERVGDFERVTLPGLEVVARPGEPSLPVRVLHVLVPGNWKEVRVLAEAEESRALGGKHRILPRQQPQVLSFGLAKSKAMALQDGSPEIYEAPGPYPGRLARVVDVKAFGEKTLVTVLVYPFRYWPKTGRLDLVERVRLHFVGPEGAEVSGDARSSESGMDGMTALVDFDLTGPESRPETANPKMVTWPAEYVVITSRALLSAFEPLVRWKNEKGVPAKAVSVEWIYRNFNGFDHQEQIREFVKYAHREWGTRWVLLGGDVWMVPMRYAFAMDCQANYADNENNIPCDLYFSDLDGDWNADGDRVFGEVEDNVDGFPDVIVGRAPVQTFDEARTFVWKDSVYERAPDPDNILRMLFLGEVLWQNPYTNSGEGKDLIDLLYVPPRFDPITKLYEALGNESVESVVRELNAGYNFVNHDGHAWYTVMGVGQGYLGRSDVRNLTNGKKLPLVFSIGCWPAAFDLECIAEDFLNNPDGGAVAFIGNSRYGWGSPGNPHFGYSDRFDQQFYRFVFQEGVQEIGRALAYAKAFYMPFARQENVYRWCEYEVNLLGDPELPLWTDVPAEPEVTHPDTLVAGASGAEIVVCVDGRPFQGARVALSQNGKLLGVGLTDAAGLAVLEADCVEPGAAAKLVVTGRNLLPYEDYLTVKGEGSYLTVRRTRVEDEIEDGLLNPGFASDLWFAVWNAGFVTSREGQAELVSKSPWLEVDMPTAVVEALRPSESRWIGPFHVVVSDTVEDGATAHVELRLPGRTVGMSLAVGWPRLRAQLIAIEGPGHIIVPGEEGAFVFGLTNKGLGAACDVQLRFRSLSEGLQVEPGPVSADSQMCVRSRETVNVNAWAAVDAAVESPWFPLIEITMEANGGRYRDCDTLQVTVGRTGFVDACLSFDHWDLTVSQVDTVGWQISQSRFNSAPTAFYCGNGRTHAYASGMADSLVSVPFTVGQDAKLTFWCWYDVAIYGVDGLYVRVLLPDGRWKSLDFIGSGGALPGRLMGNDWLPYTYDLSFLPPGTQTRLCFKFVSDGDTEAEGVYIDDVEVSSEVELGRIDAVSEQSGGNLPAEFKLSVPYPNPFNGAVQLDLDVPEKETVHVVVYDLLGRPVGDLLGQQLKAGCHRVSWRGTDDAGQAVASGVYVVRAWSEERGWTAARKLILLR